MSKDPIHPQTIFAQAVENVPPERWPDYLDETCGADQALRAQVQRLLDAHRDIGSFMAKPAAEPAATLGLAPLAEGPSAMIGRYKLLEEIGEGACRIAAWPPPCGVGDATCMKPEHLWPEGYSTLYLHGNRHPFPRTWLPYTCAESWKKTGPVEQF